MKTKLLVALIACVALGACSKTESTSKDEKKTESTTTTTTTKEAPPSHPGTPSTPPAGTQGGHSMNEDANAATTLAADSSSATAADADKKVQDMKQDMSNTANQIQGDASTATETKTAATDAHPHAED
jgi:hypothetical protein